MTVRRSRSAAPIRCPAPQGCDDQSGIYVEFAQRSRHRSTISVWFQSRTFGPKPFSSTLCIVSMTWAWDFGTRHETRFDDCLCYAKDRHLVGGRAQFRGLWRKRRNHHYRSRPAAFSSTNQTPTPTFNFLMCLYLPSPLLVSNQRHIRCAFT